MLWTRKTKDDRGREVVAATLGALLAKRDEFDPARQHLGAWIFTRCRKRGTLMRAARWLGLWLPFQVLFLTRPSEYLVNQSQWWTIALIVFAIFAAVLVYRRAMEVLAERAVHPEEICSTLVSEGFCGACGTTLRDVHAGSKHIVECPTCGAGWWGYRIVAPAWIKRTLIPPRELWTGVVPFVRPERPVPRPVCDHRGRLTSTIDARANLTAPLWPGDTSFGVRVKLQERIRRSTQMSRGFAAIGVGLLAALFVFAGVVLPLAWRDDESIPPTEIFVYVVLALIAAFASYLAHLFLPYGSPETTARLVLETGRCPSCVSLLIPDPAPDGCTVCQVCTAAWRVPGVTTTLLPGFQPPTKSSAAQSSVA